jgi:hypothetical protein
VNDGRLEREMLRALRALSMTSRVGRHIGKPESSNAMREGNPGHTTEEFQVSLTETIEWCADTADSALFALQPLRTAQLRPAPLAGNHKAVVDSVVWRRRSVLASRRLERKRLEALGYSAPTLGRQGRLLLYEPDTNLSDGAAKVETYGFFDEENVPPWDTWVAYMVEVSERDFLACWIPQHYVSLAAAGIAVNPEQCLAWLDERYPRSPLLM